MSILPRPTYPTYEIVIPSTKQKVKYRPYISKEEKVLSIAMESEDVMEITSAIKQVLQNCIQTKGVDVEKLATFDIEYLFLNIRSKAVGEEIELQVLCPDSTEEDPVYVPVKINVSDIKVTQSKNHSNNIKLEEDFSLVMKYPSFDYFLQEQFEVPTTNQEKIEKGYDLTAYCIDKICKGDEVWCSEDVGKEEIVAFLEDLVSGHIEQINEFLETMPKLEHKIKVTNPKTEVESEVTLSGIVDFFI
jgi:hypothetical protein